MPEAEMEDVQQVEEVVDGIGLKETLGILRDLAIERTYYYRHEEKDEKTAAVWEEASKAIAGILDKIRV